MQSRIFWAVATLVPTVLFASASASAHFRLDLPADAIQQATNGDPQKPANLTDACPAGTASGLVTQVRAGGTLKVRVTETIAHGGHYRISFGSSEASFQYPATTVTNNQCISTTIVQTPQLPILADGLFVHDQTAANAKNFCNGTATCERDVTIPNVAPGNYVLQVTEWMVPHGSAANNGIYGCFYSHCANLQIVAPDAGVGDGGPVVVDAGVPTSEAGSTPSDSGTGPADASGGVRDSGGGNNDDDDDDDDGFTPRPFPNTNKGCGVSSESSGAGLALPLLIVIGSFLRRRKSAS